MGTENPNDNLDSPKSPTPITFDTPAEPVAYEKKEVLKEKLEGGITGPCKNESLPNKEGKDEKNLIGLSEKQRGDLGVGIKDYVNLIVDGEGTVKRYMVVKGLKENVDKMKEMTEEARKKNPEAPRVDLFSANGINAGKKITIQKE